MEFIIQVFVEIFFELLLTAIVKVIGFVFRKIDTDQLLKRRLKFVLTYIFIGLVFTLITFSMIYSKTFLVIISLSYMLFQIIVSLLHIINADRLNDPFMKTIRILRKLSHYIYPLALIIFGTIFLDDAVLLEVIIDISSIALVTWIVIDIYRLWKRKRQDK